MIDPFDDLIAFMPQHFTDSFYFILLANLTSNFIFLMRRKNSYLTLFQLLVFYLESIANT